MTLDRLQSRVTEATGYNHLTCFTLHTYILHTQCSNASDTKAQANS